MTSWFMNEFSSFSGEKKFHRIIKLHGGGIFAFWHFAREKYASEEMEMKKKNVELLRGTT